MSDSKQDLTDVAFSSDDDDDIEIIEVVGIEDDGSEREPAGDDSGNEVVLDLDNDEDVESWLKSDAEAVAALDPLVESSAPTVATATGGPPTLDDRERFLRLQADFENFKRRTERDRRRHEFEANADLILRMLPVLDNFERALNADPSADADSMRAGVMLIFRQILEELRKQGLTAIQSVGQEFDPTVHEAVETDAKSEHPPHTVVAELQRGYKLGERLLRPALVKVAIDPAEHDVNEQLAQIGEDS